MNLYLKFYSSLLILFFTTEAYSISFRSGVDLSDTQLFKDILWIDANGDGIEDAVGIDANNHALVAKLRTTRSQAPDKTKQLGGPSGREDFITIQISDLDQDGNKDLYTLLENDIHWWRGTHTGPSYAGIWKSIQRDVSKISCIIDMDKDGHLDLVVPERDLDSFNPFRQTLQACVGYGNPQGDFHWQTYTNANSKLEWIKPIDIDGDNYPDLLDKNDLVTRFTHRQISEIVNTQGRIAMNIPSLNQKVYLNTVYDEQGNRSDTIQRYSPGGDWIPISEKMNLDELVSYYRPGTTISSIHSGAFDPERLGCLLLILNIPDPPFPNDYIAWLTFTFHGNQLEKSQFRILSGEKYLVQPRRAFAMHISDQEPDILLHNSYATETTDPFGNPLGIGNSIHDYLQNQSNSWSPVDIFPISNYHEPIQLLASPAPRPFAKSPFV